MPKIPSDVHQLLIVVSKHFHIGSKGQIRHQNKPMEMSLRKLEKSDRNHFVHYIMRDEASGFFYAECCSHRNLIPIRDFLLRSWFYKRSSTFCGIPKSIIFPKTMVDYFGDDSFSELLIELRIKPFSPTSGFSSGIRVIRDWEDDFYYKSLNDDDEDFNELQFITSWNPKTSAFYSNLKSYRAREFYCSEKRFVPETDYEHDLIKRFGSVNFKKTDLFPTIEKVRNLSLLLGVPIAG